MKNNILFILVAFLFMSCSSGSDNGKLKTEKFTVYGNCGMCKKTIESSLDGVKGIKEANWNVDNDKMTVSFNPEVISLEKIKQKIADVGYDSESHRAENEVYDNLHECCKYERPE